MPFQFPPIYPITDKSLAHKTTHLAILKELVRGGASLVQIRDKQTPVRELLPDLRLCVEFCEKRAVLLLIDDRCDLALSAGAAGVHLGQDDLPPAAARTLLGPKRIIGYSTHSIAQVRGSNELPVQYIAFGPVYPTSTRRNPSPVMGLAGLRRACRHSARPVVAIGGIGLGQVPEVLNAGAVSAAVISALMEAENIALRMEQFLNAARERGWILSRKDRSREPNHLQR